MTTGLLCCFVIGRSPGLSAGWVGGGGLERGETGCENRVLSGDCGLYAGGERERGGQRDSLTDFSVAA